MSKGRTEGKELHQQSVPWAGMLNLIKADFSPLSHSVERERFTTFCNCNSAVKFKMTLNITELSKLEF